MALSAQKFREIVFQLLYSRDFEKSDEESAMALVMRQNTIPKSVIRVAKERVEAIWDLREELDECIQGRAKDYDLERIPRIEQAVLRLGLYELLHTDLPPKVAISEGIRLARKFATAESASFVNALLDAVYKEKEHAPQTLSEEQITV
ncbi:MAG: hypothetical protein K1000chlam2_01685 [Chlamydiae bacterium]|nr:hypothetical protein [Chlamydiota bacterium]